MVGIPATDFGPVAQRNRAPVFYTGRRGFESCLGRQGRVAQWTEPPFPKRVHPGSTPGAITNFGRAPECWLSVALETMPWVRAPHHYPTDAQPYVRPFTGELSRWDLSWFAKPRVPHGMRIMLATLRQFAGFGHWLTIWFPPRRRGFDSSSPHQFTDPWCKGIASRSFKAETRGQYPPGLPIYGLMAQSVAQRTLNPKVVGSIPTQAAAAVCWQTGNSHKVAQSGSTPEAATNSMLA